jgi:hypothetical protein
LITGNGGDIHRKDLPGSLYLPDHLSFAGEENLQLILKKSGFNIKLINRYKDGGSIDNVFISLLKNVARWVLGRPIVPLWVSTTSKFRSLWIRAEWRQ